VKENAMTKTVQRFGLGLGAAAIALGMGAAVYASTQNTAAGAGPFSGRRPLLTRLGARLGPGGRFVPLRMLASRLGVTDAQKAQIKGVMQSHREEWQALGQRAAAARAALNDAVTADTPDEATIRQRSADVAAVQADIAVARARARAEIFKQLTPEQQIEARALQSKMKDRLATIRRRFQERARESTK
jgi:Spy/CpxP family protein refolding chaperone